MTGKHTAPAAKLLMAIFIDDGGIHRHKILIWSTKKDAYMDVRLCAEGSLAS